VRSGPKATVASAPLIGNRDRTAVELEQRLVGGDEITDLRHELDDPIRPVRLGDERLEVHREHDRRRARVCNWPPPALWRDQRHLDFGRGAGELAINGRDHGQAFVADVRENAHRPQQARGIVNQEEKGRRAHDAENGRDERDDLVDRALEAIERHHGEDQREDEQADAVLDDPVAQERRGDDSRGQLPAGNLNRDRQRAEREDHERQRERDDGLIERLRAGDAEPSQAPAEPAVDDFES
jgi:hypothetical protein